VSTILGTRRSQPGRSAPATALCSACGAEGSVEQARLEAWQISRDEERVHCRPCADLHRVVLDDQVLYWPDCGHLDNEVVLYDRPVCVVCEG
jgi:hypothetical protein